MLCKLLCLPLQGQKLQYQAIAKHFYFPEQTTYKKNDINMPKMKNNEDDEDECKTASKVFFCISYTSKL